MDSMMNEIDSKNTGEIDFEAFVATVTKKVTTSVTADELKKAFRVYSYLIKIGRL